jgi:regulatory protein
MAKITAIESQKRDPDRVSIYLDGEYAFGLERLVAAWLTVGQELGEDKIAALKTADASERSYQQALLFLSFRARSEAEIRQNLRKHDVPEDVIEQTLERLRENRLADDSQFARAWVENRNSFRPRGRRALAAELRQKGLTDEIASSALAGLNEEALAYEAGMKKARRFEATEWQEFRRKLSDFLARRGFPYSVIAPVVSQIWNETHPEPHIIDDEEIS